MQIWDAHTGKLLLTHQGYSYVSSVAWSPVSRQLAFNDYGTVQIWDAHTGWLLAMYESHKTDSVDCIAWSPDSRQLALGTARGTVQLLIPR